MNKILLGVALGAVSAYVLYRLAEQGKLDCIYRDMSKIADQTKKKIKDGLDIAQNNVEYLEDRVKHKSKEIKEALDDLSEKITRKPSEKAKG